MVCGGGPRGLVAGQHVRPRITPLSSRNKRGQPGRQSSSVNKNGGRSCLPYDAGKIFFFPLNKAPKAAGTDDAGTIPAAAWSRSA